jgi:hypothetical protein
VLRRGSSGCDFAAGLRGSDTEQELGLLDAELTLATGLKRPASEAAGLAALPRTLKVPDTVCGRLRSTKLSMSIVLMKDGLFRLGVDGRM